MDGFATLSTVESKRMAPMRAGGARKLESPRQNSPAITLQRNICCTPCVFSLEYVVEDESAEREIELRRTQENSVELGSRGRLQMDCVRWAWFNGQPYSSHLSQSRPPCRKRSHSYHENSG